MGAYYNERDPFAAAWLRELIKQNLIAPGEVDERDILDVRPCDLKSFTQCHFFAGIGVWSYALRLAGWPDDRRVWTGSCPCQPFSTAGKAGGFDDERHLWPALHYLIEECRPGVVFGEQVASKDGLAWLDLVQADMEGAGYAIGALDTCAAGFGAPHIRQRLWFVADAANTGQFRRRPGEAGDGRGPARFEPQRFCDADGLANADGGHASAKRQQRSRQQRQFAQDSGAVRRLGNTECERTVEHAPSEQMGLSGCARQPGSSAWAEIDWIACRDGKSRPVEPGTFPLAHGAPARVGRLRGYGNAIVAPQAAEFIKAYIETRGYFRMTLLEVMTELAERGLLFSLYQTSEHWICNIRSADNKRLLGRATGDNPDEVATQTFEDAEGGILSAEEAHAIETKINAETAEGDLFG